MTWDRIASAGFVALCSILAWTWTISSSYGTLPDRVTAVEIQQQKDGTELQKKADTSELHNVKTTLSRIEGQLDFIVDYVKRGRK